MTDHGLDLAVIGNGRTAALVDPHSRIVWWCYPRFDGDPIFCRLVSGKEEKGFSDVVLDDIAEFQSEYVRNTAIVSTVLTDQHGGKVKITDFAPRFRQFGRVFRPPQLFRIVEPIAGLPRITIRMRPTCDYGKPLPQSLARQQSHPLFHGSTVIRLTTDAPLSLIESESPFVLTRPLHLVFGPDEPYLGDLQQTCREFAERTHDYWMEWVRRLSISYDWQEAIIRAAITLKLSNFDETGGIIAAHTTSIPEAPSSGRTWDYRYCWLRDAYFVVQALNRIGATRTMEEFISFTLSIASKLDHELRPVYSIVPTTSIEERTAPDLEGYRGDGPVRIGNAAVDQIQHDTYGSVILAAMPMFFDRRLPRPGDEGLFHLLESLGDRAARKAFEPDAGIWEYRGRSRIHTHSAAMCWAGCQRLAAIANRIGLADRAKYWNSIAEPMHAALIERRLEREARRVHRGVRLRRSRRQRAALGRSRRRRSRRSALRLDRRRHGARADAREARHALRQCRRFRHAGDGFPDLPVLADRRAVVARPARGGERPVHRCARTSQPLRTIVRRRRSADRRAVGQFSADLFDGGTDPFRHAAVAQLGRSLLARVINAHWKRHRFGA